MNQKHHFLLETAAGAPTTTPSALCCCSAADLRAADWSLEEDDVLPVEVFWDDIVG